MFINYLIFVGLIALAYFMGSLAPGVYLGKKYKGIDIREHGSKNTGTTNAFRVLGPKIGGAVFVVDVMKGFLPVIVARAVYGNTNILVVLVGVTAILGHTFSLFLNYKGGKGVATSLGVFMALIPVVMAIEVVIFALVFLVSRYISLSSITAAVTLPVLIIIFYGLNKLEILIPAVVTAVFIVYKHKSNIDRLIKGTENRFDFKSKGKVENDLCKTKNYLEDFNIRMCTDLGVFQIEI